MGYEEIRAGHPKARKKYNCEWCNQNIEVGEKHFSRAYKFEGDFNHGRMHLECEKAMNKSPHDLVSEGWLEGENIRGETLS